MVATLYTLFFVPVTYSLLRRESPEGTGTRMRHEPP